MSDALRAALVEKAKRELARRRSSQTDAAQRNPDGTYGQPPEGAFQNAAGQVVDPALQAAQDERVIAAYPVAGRVQEAVQGIPILGEFADETVGALGQPETADTMRRVSDAFERQRPGQSMALNIGGGVASAIPLAAGAAGAKAVDFVSRGGNALTRALRVGAVAAPGGAVEGAASFAGRAEDGERLAEAGKGALIGGGMAAALGPFASLIGEGATAMAKRIKRLDVRTIADEFGLKPEAARVVKQALANDDLDAAAARLSQLGDDAMLADAGPGTAALLDASANTGGAALRVARDAAETRATQVGQRLGQTLDGLLGKPGGVKAAARDIASETSPARQAAYDLAYSKPIDYAAASGRKVEEVLSRVPARTMQSAVQEANDAMTAAGLRNQQIMAEIADDGSVAFREMPNVQQLDFLKRALDDVARGNTDQFGRFTEAGNRARRLAAQLRDSVREAVPEYGRALRIGGDKIQRDEALALGKNMLSRRTTLEDVQQFMRQGVSAEAKQALRQGLREGIEEALSNVRRTITDPNTDAREAMQLVKEMSSRANVGKLQQILGTQRANRLLQELDRTAAALELRAAIATNSKTAIRQSIQEQVSDEAAPGMVRRTAGNMGNPLEAAQDITRTITGIDPRSMSAREKAIFDEISDRLVNIRGEEAQRALAAVRRAMAGQPLKNAEAALIGRVAGGSLGLGSYQTGMQSLETQ
ncbi:hypothetical protein [Leisingera sp. ANG-M7]|uniref:hypothetical protein n=1 Tax=Leisingera sp. ANG-M7 TaxID=1577902 RepID=UPI00057CBC79|nr:hypothetical protein [Leisingera sp. ANG-M7]KIC39356.1 hypothetical protein RA26_01500 [Leisingera sp. ANG-M7]